MVYFEEGKWQEGGMNMSHYLISLLMESAIFLLNLCDGIGELGKENLSNLGLFLSTCSNSFLDVSFSRYALYN